MSGQERVTLPELEEPKILSPLPFATMCVNAYKTSWHRDGNNKNKSSLWLPCWQRISILWASSVNGKNSFPHVSHSLNAKKAVIKRQKQRYSSGGILLDPQPSPEVSIAAANLLLNKE